MDECECYAVPGGRMAVCEWHQRLAEEERIETIARRVAKEEIDQHKKQYTPAGE